MACSLRFVICTFLVFFCIHTYPVEKETGQIPYNNAPSISEIKKPAETYTWGVIYYMSYDNNLEKAGNVILDNIRTGLKETNTIAGVQADFTDTGGMHRYAFTGSGIYHTRVTSDNSADEKICTDYIEWFIDKFPCRHYAVIFLNHGDSLDRMCRDDTPDKRKKREWMSASILGQELRRLKKEKKISIEFLFLQQCGRGSLTSLYNFRETAEFVMFSPRRIGSPNTYYTPFHQYLAKHPDAKGNEIARFISEKDRDYSVYACANGSQISQIPSKLDLLIKQWVAKGKPARMSVSQVEYESDSGELFFDLFELTRAFTASGIADKKKTDAFNSWIKTMLLTDLCFSKTADAEITRGCGLTMYVPLTPESIKGYAHLDLMKASSLDEFWVKMFKN